MELLRSHSKTLQPSPPGLPGTLECLPGTLWKETPQGLGVARHPGADSSHLTGGPQNGGNYTTVVGLSQHFEVQSVTQLDILNS